MTEGDTAPTAPRRRTAAALRAIAAGAALLACGHGAFALSSGVPRGTPLIGRPLQLAIPVTWERGAAPPCVRAAFLQGESPGGPLHWRLDHAGDAQGLLRLTSTLPVQEPAITVQVALGCGEQYAREYVLLAEPPSEERDAQAAAEAGTGHPVALAPLALAPATSLASPAGSQPTAMPPAPPAAAASLPTTPGVQRPHRAHAPARRTAPAQAGAPREASAKPAPARASSSGPRLTLEPIDIAIDEAPLLRLTSTLAPGAPAAAGGGALRAEEARGLWQALSTPPEQQAAQAEAALALQKELQAMRELVQRQGAENRATALRLEAVSSQRDLVLQILLGLVVVLGGGFGYLLWLRSRETAVLRSWWEEEHRSPQAAQPARTGAPAPLAAGEAACSVPPAGGEPAPAPPSDLVELPDFLEFDQQRVLSAEELLGLKEKADFFLAVGQPEKAVQLLESQLQEHTSSPFVWLDLLDLCRRLERREDYERLRAAFQKLFAARMPAFEAAMLESKGLEDHPRALSRITQLWGTQRVLKVIEDSLFEEAKPGSITFDLEASRELLLLYGIASEGLAAATGRENFGGAFPSTMRTPLVAATPTGTEPVPLVALDALNWPASLLPPQAEPAGAMAPAEGAAAPVPAAASAAAPDIVVGELDSLLPDDLDFSLSLSPVPPPEGTR